MNDSQSELDMDDDDWGDFDSNIDEDDYDASTLDNNIINSKIEQKSSTQYEIFTQNDIKLKINDIVQNVSSYLELPKWTATLLLRYFKWNKEDILEKYWKHDTEELLRKCGVLTNDLKQKPPKYANNKFECPMCLNEDINVSCNAFKLAVVILSVIIVGVIILLQIFEITVNNVSISNVHILNVMLLFHHNLSFDIFHKI